MRRLIPLLALVVAAAAPDPDPVVAQRGAVSLTTSEVRALVASLDPPTRKQLEADPAALAQFVRGRVLQLALLAEAHDKQWDQRPDIALRAQRARETAIVDSYVASLTEPDPAFPSDGEIAAAYEANKQRFLVPRQYHLAQIFLPLPADAPKAAQDEAQKKLADLRRDLGKPKADFGDAARKTSQDPASAAKGGELGWVREDQMLPAIRTAVAGLADNAVSDPLRGPEGWHLVKLLGTRPAAVAPLADVRPSLVAAMRQEKQAQNARAYVAELLKQDPVQLNEIALSKAAR